METIFPKRRRYLKLFRTFNGSQPGLRREVCGSFMDSPDEEERHRVARDIVFSKPSALIRRGAWWREGHHTRARTAARRQNSSWSSRDRCSNSASSRSRPVAGDQSRNCKSGSSFWRQSARICRDRHFSLPEIFEAKTKNVDLGLFGEVVDVSVEPAYASVFGAGSLR